MFVVADYAMTKEAPAQKMVGTNVGAGAGVPLGQDTGIIDRSLRAVRGRAPA